MSVAKHANSPSDEMEQAFFQLAFERLQEKLYNLLPYMVGFEIADRSQDGSKLLGVFGFKSNNGQMIFVPAFFINGDVKGVDLMYSKNNEQFYPLNEDFAELFLKDDSTGIGDVTKKTRQEINRNMPMTDLQSLVRPPRTGKVSYASVIDYVEQSDPLVKQAFYSMFVNNDDFCESILRFYPIEKVAKAVYVPKQAMPVVKPKVYVVKAGDDLSELNDDQKREVLSRGMVVIDHRSDEEKSKFGLLKYEEKFTNPTDSGFYSYLTNSGSLRYALIITKPLQLDRHFPTDESIVVDLSSSQPGQSYFVKNNEIITKGHYTLSKLSEVISEMENIEEATPSFDDTYILMNDRCVATVPFRIRTNYKGADKVRRIGVSAFRRSSDSPRWRNSFYNDKREFETTLIMTKKPGDNLQYDGKTILVPKGFKLLRVKFGVADPLSFDEEARDAFRAAREEYERNRPGSKESMFTALRADQTFPLTVNSNGSEYFVSVGTAKKKYDSALSAKVGMVLDFGLSFNDANTLISSVPDFGRREGTIKLAYLGDQAFSPWDPTPYSNELGQPTYDGVGHSEVMPTDNTYTGDPTRQGLADKKQDEGLSGAIAQATQLAQSGQKQIFDTHTIATLAKYVNPEAKISAYMPDFIAALDKLGRMLYLVHWETDKFEEMYGRSELPELVELLTNVFRNLGDLVIFLKQKSPTLSINMSERDVDT